MAIGSREEPEKELDSLFRPKSYQRISRKPEKRMSNKKFRLESKLDMNKPYKKTYKGWEW